MESIIFVSVPFKGVFWDFKVDRRIFLTQTVKTKIEKWDFQEWKCKASRAGGQNDFKGSKIDH